jgi:hypothetical protein
MFRSALVLGVLATLMTVSQGISVAQDKKNADEPDVIEISKEKFACNADTITIETAKGKVELKKNSESALLPIRDSKIKWWCGNADEDWAAPAGTEYIVVSRGPRGAGNVVYYKKK